MKITVGGSLGDMGKRLIRLINENENLEFFQGMDKVPNEKTVTSLEKLKPSDGIIDFSSPILTMELLKFAIDNKIPIVIATTGFNDQQKQKIKAASEFIPILFSPNMSLGVNVLFKLTDIAARALPDFENEIVEIHHNRKVDAPSGTAKRLGEILNASSDKKIIYGREGHTGKREKEELGIFAVRGGDVAGEHTVYFFGNGERLELTHRASNRDTFAIGAINAMKFLFGKEKGLYSMQDVLG
jgi:4-hydroxy-tetrahydrodipicolinate reductase